MVRPPRLFALVEDLSRGQVCACPGSWDWLPLTQDLALEVLGPLFPCNVWRSWISTSRLVKVTEVTLPIKADTLASPESYQIRISGVMSRSLNL